MADNFQNRQAAPRKPNALNEYKLRLSADPAPGSNRRPTLGISVHKNQPQIDVRTNVEGDIEYGRISAKLDGFTFTTFLAKLEEIIRPETPADTKFIIKCFAGKFIQGQRSEPKLDTQVVIGKDRENMLYIAVTSWQKERPIIKFIFKPHEEKGVPLFQFYDGTGNPLSPAEVSRLYASGYLKLLETLVPNVLCSEYVEPPPPPQRDNNGGGNNGGGGGYNNNRGGGGGGNNSYGNQRGNAADGFTSDDLPL